MIVIWRTDPSLAPQDWIICGAMSRSSAATKFMSKTDLWFLVKCKGHSSQWGRTTEFVLFEMSNLGAKHVNSLWPIATIWLYKSGSSLAQVMACCLTAPSHYPNQCWLFIIEVLWNSSESNFIVVTQTTIMYNKFENYAFEIIATSPWGQWVNSQVLWGLLSNLEKFHLIYEIYHSKLSIPIETWRTTGMYFCSHYCACWWLSTSRC